MYLTSRIFSSPDTAFIAYVSLNFIFGLCTMLMTTMPRLLAILSRAQVSGCGRACPVAFPTGAGWRRAGLRVHNAREMPARSHGRPGLVAAGEGHAGRGAVVSQPRGQACCARVWMCGRLAPESRGWGWSLWGPELWGRIGAVPTAVPDHPVQAALPSLPPVTPGTQGHPGGGLAGLCGLVVTASSP